MTKDVFLQWAFAASAITLGSFLIFGLPQIYAWRRTTTPNRPTLDARTAWAVRMLSHGRVVLFVLASVTGGSLGDRLVLRPQTPSTGGVLHRAVVRTSGDPLGRVLPRGYSRVVVGGALEEPGRDGDSLLMIDSNLTAPA